MSLTTARMAAALDTGLTAATHIAWSETGSGQSANVAPTALTGDPKLKAATTANPSVKSNNGAHESAAASSGCTITHWAFASDDTPTLVTTWNALDDDAVLLAGGKITVADGALKENLHQTTSAPA
jgi:hypothetical protein